MNVGRYLRPSYEWISPRRWLRRVVFWGGAIVIGVLATVFAVGAELANEGFHAMVAISPWAPVLIMPAGMALVVYLTRVLFPGTQGSGIPQTIAALSIKDPVMRTRLLSVRIALSKIGLTLLGLLSGASVGREGPTVQIGASIMHAFGQLGRFPRQDIERGLILAGGAAGISAAFNTPMAGIVFAMEELSRSMEDRTNGLIISAVVLAGITALGILGDYVYFGQTAAVLKGEEGWIAVILCGVVGGFAGGLFSRVLIASSRGLPGRLGMFANSRPVLFAAACGLLLALIGLASGGTTYGTGYYEAKQLLEGSVEVPETFGILKLVATAVSYLSGIPGGIFAPSLSIGAGLGANLTQFVPFAPVGAIVLLSMVAYFTGVVQAPITAFIVVMEMTDNHSLVLPLMATALVAQGASRLVCRQRLYAALAERFLEFNNAAKPKPRDEGQESGKRQAPVKVDTEAGDDAKGS